MAPSVLIHRAADLGGRVAYPGLLVMLAAAVLPFFLLTQYAHPSGDDFCYADLFRGKSFWSGVTGEYLGWKGRYTAIVATAAFHNAGGMLATYGYALVLLLASFFLALYVFVHALVEGARPRSRTLFLTLGLGALYLGTMPLVPAGLYWIDGAFQYQLGIIFLLPCVAALFTLYRTGSSVSAGCACPLLFLAIGTTELVMITLVVLTGILAFDRMLIHVRQRPAWTVILVVTALSTALLVLAPGNAVRAESASPDAGRFWYAFSHAWYHSGTTLASWLASPGLWLATAVFVPVALKLVYLDRIRKEATWLRFLVVAGLVPALIWTYFFGLWWAAATNPPGRALNLIYLVFLAGWFAAVLELIGAVARQRRLVFTEEVFPAPLRLANLAVIGLLGAVLLLQGQARNAYGDLLYRAPGYDRGMQNRYARIAHRKDEAEGRLAMTFRAIPDPPRVVMYTDIQGDEDNWRNGCFARYFGLDSVARQQAGGKRTR